VGLSKAERPELPAVKNQDWVRTSVDAFILARLEKHGMAPAAPADRATLLRRVTFDLTGLPPTHAEMQAFLADKSPDAYAKVVDRLLDSPRYGERWARLWLDVARYADTKGYGTTLRPHVWRYRDQVIKSSMRTALRSVYSEQLAGMNSCPTSRTGS
jgi:hypothetical protein